MSALRIVVDGTEAWRLAAEAGPKRQRGRVVRDQVNRTAGFPIRYASW
ncbi:MAG TPA: hypothetical protein VG253_16505 [Streptosporangiaceae bacterium]|nr:hypothetical protein [Streptosporangiaceae bacterium]